MSGASGKIPSAIHVCPEAVDGGLIAKINDGDIIRLDATAGTLDVIADGIEQRSPVAPDITQNGFGTGREMFELFRQTAGRADTGAGVIV